MLEWTWKTQYTGKQNVKSLTTFVSKYKNFLCALLKIMHYKSYNDSNNKKYNNKNFYSREKGSIKALTSAEKNPHMHVHENIYNAWE